MSAECRPPPPEYYPAAYPSPQLQQYEDAPPPYCYPQQQQQHKTASKPVVVTSQPTRTPAPRVRVQPASDNFLMLSIVLTTMFLVCWCWYPLCCSVPAILFAMSARDAEARRDFQGARTRKMSALGCNIASLIWWIVGLGLLIGASVVSRSRSSSYYTYRPYSSYYY